MREASDKEYEKFLLMAIELPELAEASPTSLVTLNRSIMDSILLCCCMAIMKQGRLISARCTRTEAASTCSLYWCYDNCGSYCDCEADCDCSWDCDCDCNCDCSGWDGYSGFS